MALIARILVNGISAIEENKFSYKLQKLCEESCPSGDWCIKYNIIDDSTEIRIGGDGLKL